ncbi:MAG: metallophosphoesterase [Oscillospiraceae bacterium]
MKKGLTKPTKFLLLAALAVFAAVVLLVGYMRLEYKNIKTTNLSLQGQDAALAGIKIVYAVDFQYDMQSGRIEDETFQKAIDKIKAEQPDLILLGGDYITNPDNRRAAIPYLAQLEAPLGVYAVFGNHDARARQFFKEELTNIHFLENETVYIAYNGTSLALTGVEDLWTGRPVCQPDAVQKGQYGILLSHNPDFFETLAPELKDQYSLTLSGHIHAGQITFFGLFGVPFVLDSVTDYGEKYRYGEKVYDGHRIYVSSGLGGGVANLAVRFFAQPEIVLIA